jgi:hypothetical protein
MDENNAERCDFKLISPFGIISVSISADIDQDLPFKSNLQISRAGNLMHGIAEDDLVTLGWVSPTYGNKTPALSLAYHVVAMLPVTFRSEYIFPKRER